MEIMHFCIRQFSDEQSNFVMGGSALKFDQGQVEESVNKKYGSENKELLAKDVR